MNRKIKILVDVHYFDEFYSGVTTYIKGIYNELVKNEKFEIYLLGRNLPNLEKNFTSNKFKYIELKNKSKINRFFLEIPKIIERYKIDYAHFQYVVPPIKRCKYIVTIHDVLFIDYPLYFPKKYRYSRTFSFFLSSKLSDIVLTVSKYSRERISKHFLIKKNKITVTPNGILNEYFIPIVSENNSKEKYILYVSRIEPRKNHLSLLKAFIELKLYQEYKLIFIGQKAIEYFDFYNYLENLNKEIRKKIFHLENVSEYELKNYYQNASLFVYPSFAEGFGIPPLEALVSKVKVICANSTALKDFGFLEKYFFNPNDLEELKQIICSTLVDNNYPFNEIMKFINETYQWSSISKILEKKIMSDYLGKN